MKKIVVFLSVLLVAGCSGKPTEEETKMVSAACENFITKQMGGDYKVETHVFDVYKKKGKLVAEVGYRDKYSDESYSVRLCVLDEEKETISSPSPLNDSEWSKE